MATTEDNNPRHRLMARLKTRPKAPDWEAWKKCVSASLWEAVALLCRIEPSDIRGWKLGIAKCRPPSDFEIKLCFAESLLDINGGGLKCRLEGEQSDTARVELGNFRTWLEYEGVHFPSEFPIFTASAPPIESPDKRRLRLTSRIAEVEKTRKDFMATVAKEEGIGIARLQQIVGNTLERKNRLKAINL